MKIKIKYYSVYQNMLKKNEEIIEINNSAMVSDVFEWVMKDYPQKNNFLKITRFAVNSEFSSLEHRLKEGDEVVFIPPVSGG